MSERFRVYDWIADAYGPARETLAEAEADVEARLREYERDHVNMSEYVYVISNECTCKQRAGIASWLRLRDPVCPACRALSNPPPARKRWRWADCEWLKLDYWIYLE